MWVVINLDRLTPLAGDATITKDIITSRVELLGEASSRDLGLILIETKYRQLVEHITGI